MIFNLEADFFCSSLFSCFSSSSSKTGSNSEVKKILSTFVKLLFILGESNVFELVLVLVLISSLINFWYIFEVKCFLFNEILTSSISFSNKSSSTTSVKYFFLWQKLLDLGAFFEDLPLLELLFDFWYKIIIKIFEK